jgi:predicted ester cyclase
MHGAFPDLRLELHELLGEGDLTAVRLTMYGTHRGDHLGFAASHKPVIAHGIVMIRWRNGVIVEGWNEFDSAGSIRALASN